MSDFKPIYIHSDNLPNGMTMDDFIELFLEANGDKNKSLDDIVDLERFYAYFDEEEAKDKIRAFMKKHNMNMPQMQQQSARQPLYASNELDKK